MSDETTSTSGAGSGAATASAPSSLPYTRRKAAWLPVWLLLTFNIYWVVWLYRTYKEARAYAASATSISAGRSVGFLFIPLFNIFWFLRIALDLPRTLARTLPTGADGAESFPRGSITGMLITAMLLNTLAGYVYPGAFIAGEILLATALVYCQRRMNEPISAEPAPSAPGRRTFAELVGAAGPSVDIRRAVAFALASFAFLLVSFVAFAAVVNIAFSAEDVPTISLGWRTIGERAVMGLWMAVAAVVAYRYVGNPWLAAVTGGLIYTVGESALFGAVSMQSATVAFVSTSFLFAAIALLAPLTRSIWSAVLLGALCAEFADTMIAWLLVRDSWYPAFSRALAASADPYLNPDAWIAATEPARDLVVAITMALALWLAHLLWVVEEVE